MLNFIKSLVKRKNIEIEAYSVGADTQTEKFVHFVDPCPTISLSSEERGRMIAVIHEARAFYGDEPMWNISLEELNRVSDERIHKLHNDTRLNDIGWG